MLSHQAFAAHSLHSAESPTAPTVEMDLLPMAPRATAPVASAAAALGPPEDQQQGLNFSVSKGITLKVSAQTPAP